MNDTERENAPPIELTELTERAGDSTTTINVENTDLYPTGLRLILITLGLILSIFLSALDSTIIATAIPSITDEFGSISDIAWYGSAYSITNAAFQSTWGKAYKLFPLKRTFLLAIIIFELGNLLCGIAPSSDVLILGRVVSGIGGGGAMTFCFICISLTSRPKYRPAYMGVLGVTFGCASVAGPLMGGALTDGPGWRWCFWISIPIGILAASIVILFFTQPRSSMPFEATLKDKVIQLDLSGGLLVTGALSCFVLCMHWAGSRPWTSASVLGSLFGSVATLSLFVFNEYLMGSNAMIPRHLLKKRSILSNLGFIFFLAGLFFPLLYVLPIQFQAINNESAQGSGMRLIPLVLGVSVFTMVANGILTYWKHYNPFLVVGAILGTAGAAAITTLDASTSISAWIGSEILTASGVGLSLQLPMISNQASVSSEDIAAVTALSLFAENLGTSIFVAAAEAAFTSGLIASLREHVPGIDPMTVVNAGATQIRNNFAAAEAQGIILSYVHACKVSHVVSVACGGAASVLALAYAAPSGAREVRRRIGREHAP